MTSIIFFIIFIPILGIVLLGINFLLAPHKPYKEKKTPFECGFHSFVGQNRKQFSVIFFIYSIMFMIFDLELFFAFPLGVSIGLNDALGIITLVIFFLILTLGFVFELGSNALNLDTKQIKSVINFNKLYSYYDLFSLFVIIVFFYYFKNIVRILCEAMPGEVYTLLPVCFTVAVLSCIIFVVKSYCKGDYSFSVFDLLKIFAYTFVVACFINLLSYLEYINISMVPYLYLCTLLFGMIDGIPISVVESGEILEGVLKMEGQNVPSSSKASSSDIIEQISETGFIDDKHLELASKVQEPEEGTTFGQYQEDVKNLKNYVDHKNLGEYKEHWRKRDDELISQSRSMYAHELLENSNKEEFADKVKKRGMPEKDLSEQGSSKKR